MKALLLIGCLIFTSVLWAEEVEVETSKLSSQMELPKVFQSQSDIRKAFVASDTSSEKTLDLYAQLSQLENKKLSVYRILDDGTRIFDTDLEIVEDQLVATSTEEVNEVDLLIKGNYLNFGNSKNMCEDACIAFPIGLKKIEGEFPVLLKIKASFAGEPLLTTLKGIIVVKDTEE